MDYNLKWYYNILPLTIIKKLLYKPKPLILKDMIIIYKINVSNINSKKAIKILNYLRN